MSQLLLHPRSSPESSSGFRLPIDGHRRAAQGEAYFAAHDPYRESDWGRVAEAQAADVDAGAVEAASGAFRDGRCSGRPAGGPMPAARLADLIEREAEALINQQIFENGKLISEMRPGMAAVAGDCRFFAGLAEAHGGVTVPSPRPRVHDLYSA